MKFLENILKLASYLVLIFIGLSFFNLYFSALTNPEESILQIRNQPLNELLKETKETYVGLISGNQNTNDQVLSGTARGSLGTEIKSEAVFTGIDLPENHQLPIILPVQGNINISSGFGRRRDPFNGRPSFHNGIDIPVSTGTPIRATGSGQIAKTGYNSLLGKYITIQHDDDYSSIYGHLSIILVMSGQPVKIGEIIGYSGNTGRSTSPHLHYQINHNGRPVDPMQIKQKLNGSNNFILWKVRE